MTALPFAEIRKGCLCHNDGPEEVRFDLRAKIRHGCVFDRREIAVSRVVDNNVQRAKRIDSCVHSSSRGGGRALWRAYRADQLAGWVARGPRAGVRVRGAAGEATPRPR